MCNCTSWFVSVLPTLNVLSVSRTRFSTVVGIRDTALPLALLSALICGPEFIKMSKRDLHIFHSPALLAHSSGHRNYQYLQSLSSSPPLVSRVQIHSTSLAPVIDK